MEETMEPRPGIVERVFSIFNRQEQEVDDFGYETRTSESPTATVRPSYRYTVTLRRQVSSFDDALAAANGLKRGEQQIVNLTNTDPVTRQKVVDFLCGVNFAVEGTWEEVGEHIYIVTPANAYVEIAPATPRMNSVRN